ncbi:hypothetical protein SCUP515_05386 [Seiridium cupressi]
MFFLENEENYITPDSIIFIFICLVVFCELLAFTLGRPSFTSPAAPELKPLGYYDPLDDPLSPSAHPHPNPEGDPAPGQWYQTPGIGHQDPKVPYDLGGTAIRGDSLITLEPPFNEYGYGYDYGMTRRRRMRLDAYLAERTAHFNADTGV